MDFFYFLVKNAEYWESHYHENFFIKNDGFLYGGVCALVVGILVCCVFYFGCCNSSKTHKYATKSMWTVSLILSAVIAFCIADFFIIGTEGSESGFYKANEDYYIHQSNENSDNEAFLAELSEKKDEIRENLDDGGDARIDFSLTTAILSIICFYLCSLGIKHMTINGKTVPHKWPMYS